MSDVHLMPEMIEVLTAVAAWKPGEGMTMAQALVASNAARLVLSKLAEQVEIPPLNADRYHRTTNARIVLDLMSYRCGSPGKCRGPENEPDEKTCRRCRQIWELCELDETPKEES